MHLSAGATDRWFYGGASRFRTRIDRSQCESHGAGDVRPVVPRRFILFARNKMKSISRRLSRFVSQSLAGSGVIALACAIGPGAQAQTLGSLVQVAAGDPFIGCTADQVHAQESGFGSILFPSTSIEPSLAADPTITNIRKARLRV